HTSCLSDWSSDVCSSDLHTTFQTSVPGVLGTQDHTYADNGTYTARVTVTDGDQAPDSTTFVVAVANVAPTAAIQGAPLAGPEGSPQARRGAARACGGRGG